MKTLIAVTLIIALFSGCIPVMIGAAVYSSVKSDDARNYFLANFRMDNIEREAKGLEPLDFCEEVFRFDPSWADDLPECAAFVDAQVDRVEVKDGKTYVYMRNGKILVYGKGKK